MHRIVDVPASHRIFMDVLDLLPHHLFRFDHLWVTSFLPKLKVLVDFVAQFKELQLLQQSRVFHYFHYFHFLDDRLSSERFKFSDAFCKLWSHGDPMKMVFQDDVRNDLDFTFLLKELPTVKDHFNEVAICKYGQPSNYRIGHKMRVVVLSESVT